MYIAIQSLINIYFTDADISAIVIDDSDWCQSGE